MALKHSALEREPARGMLRPMMSPPQPLHIAAPPAWNTPSLLSFEDLAALFARRWPIIALTCAAFMAIGAIYVATAKRQYTAVAHVQVDLVKPDILPNPGGGQPAFLNLETMILNSDLEIARSDVLRRDVAVALDVANDPEYNAVSVFGAVRRGIGQLVGLLTFKPPSPGSGDELKFVAFADRVRAERVGQSLLIRFSYWSHDPNRAAEVANAVAEAYVAHQVKTQREASAKITLSLQDRLRQMRDEVAAAEVSAATFRAENIVTEATGASDLDRQLADLNTQASAARAEADALKARVDRLLRAIEGGDVAQIGAAAAENPAIVGLQSDLARARTDPATLGAEVERLEGAVRAVARETLARWQASYNLADSRARNLSTEVERVKQIAARIGLNQVQLRELQRRAESARAIYDVLLTAFNRSFQSQSLPAGRFALVEAATPPVLPSWPKTPLVLASCLVLGLGVSSGYVLLREGVRRTFESPREVEAALRTTNVVPVGQLSLVDAGGLETYRLALSDADGRARDGMNDLLQILLMAGSPPSGGALVAGITSVHRGEGKTTTAGLLAAHLAASGLKVLVADVDLEGRGLSRQLDLPETLDVPVLEPGTGVWVLSAGERGRGVAGILNGGFARAITAMRPSYDVIILDLPALREARYPRALGPALHLVLLVVEANRTRRGELADALAHSPELAERIIGAILNRARSRVLGPALLSHIGRAWSLLPRRRLRKLEQS
ncbi:GumC family protein [Salinarimonas soli]|uniref:Polysaccharide biosynthesis tyrosine autokinase n=1 Tax=Salinarimonas soli TaxID=1638099 RepID=A0A5B2V733_9HYPH|nr:exopolysaccharide transport family protein [Salinarimonas soli]KAA2234784.1 polysaccharide biosynthesis tyrosine autokinase [Salinarimonas soli]